MVPHMYHIPLESCAEEQPLEIWWRLKMVAAQTSHPQAGTPPRGCAPPRANQVKKPMTELGDLPLEAAKKPGALEPCMAVLDLKRQLWTKPAPAADEEATGKGWQQAKRGGTA